MALNANNYQVDYEDEAFQKVDDDAARRDDQLNQAYGTYDEETGTYVGGMIGNTDKYFEDLKKDTEAWGEKQAEIQQANTDFAIETIEQQREQAEKDYKKEQSGAYVDWQKQSNQYGVEAEKMASSGLTGSGFSESSQVAMYNQYQNRVATAREVMAKANLNYDNSIKEAMLQNNAALAEIALTTLEKSHELALQAFQYKNQLISDLTNKKLELERFKSDEYQRVLNQMNTENALAAEIDKHNDTLSWQEAQVELDRLHDEHMAEVNHNYEIKLLDAKTEKEKEILAEQHANDIAKLNKQLENEKAALKYEYELKNSSYGGVIGSSSGGSSNKSIQEQIYNKITGKTTDKLPLNMDSVLALGMGIVDETQLANLIKSGQVIMYESNGQTYVEKNPNYKSNETIPKIFTSSNPLTALTNARNINLMAQGKSWWK